MLIIAKKLLPKLMTQKHETIHTFLSKSDTIEESYSHSIKESDQSVSSINISQIRSQQSDTNS